MSPLGLTEHRVRHLVQLWFPSIEVLTVVPDRREGYKSIVVVRTKVNGNNFDPVVDRIITQTIAQRLEAYRNAGTIIEVQSVG